MAEAKTRLTDDEGTFLSLLLRIQPATAYQISKVYADSPVSNFGTSKGKIYPMIRRLQERELIASTTVAGDGRGSETLKATAAGKEAIRRWVRDIRPAHLLLEDPLRTRVQSFNLLSLAERLKWLASAKAQLSEKLRQVEEYGAEVDVPFKDFVHDNAVTSIQARISWLDRMEDRLRAES